MRHLKAGRKLGRNKGSRQALFRSLLNALIEHECVRTTLAKAKTIRPQTEKLITLARVDSMHNRSLAFKALQKKTLVKKLFETVGPRDKDRQGGYTRILKLGPRQGDGAQMAQIELV
jgi:large subunit ribosomal protein L17